MTERIAGNDPSASFGQLLGHAALAASHAADEPNHRDFGVGGTPVRDLRRVVGKDSHAATSSTSSQLGPAAISTFKGTARSRALVIS